VLVGGVDRIELALLQLRVVQGGTHLPSVGVLNINVNMFVLWRSSMLGKVQTVVDLVSRVRLRLGILRSFGRG